MKLSGTALRLAQRFIGLERKREPDLVIGDPKKPYMRRWYVIPRNNFFNVYYHHICRSDDDRAKHTHPWAFNISILLKGFYLELTDGVKGHGTGTVLFRWGAAPHRLVLPAGDSCRTLFITGPKVREWYFLCSGGRKVHWKDFTGFKQDGTSGRVGPGCGET